MIAPARRLRALWILCTASPGLVLVLLWVPVIDHYYVPRIAISDHAIDRAKRYPSDELLSELGSFRFFVVDEQNEEELVQRAASLLRQVADSRRSARHRYNLFAPDELMRMPGQQLFIASLGVARTFLEAYEVSQQKHFFTMARDVVLAFADYERSNWLPKGLLWNDHAISERVMVLAEFWRFYRNHPQYDSSVARDVLELVARHGRFLASPRHFTFSTNHGIMQNLALLHYAIAFPSLPDAENYKRLAFDRLQEQMQFYVNDEGVVLEHSSTYQHVGIRFMAMAMRYATLLDVAVPSVWIEKYRRARELYAHLRLPDASLPIFGDTVSGPSRLSSVDLDRKGKASSFRYEAEWRPHREHSLYPVAGYSIWWSGLEHWPDAQHLGQLAVSWSHFPGHAHKHADEMSLSLWSAGQRWVTNIGYWPYYDARRRQAVSWIGSNAPHRVDEEYGSTRETTLRYFGSSKRLAFIDLNREETSGYNAGRQVIWKKPNIWIVVDRVSCDSDSRSRTVWNTPHDVRLEKGLIPGSVSLYGSGGKVLTGIFFGSGEVHMFALNGSDSPFAGWEVRQDKVVPASAILVEQPCDDSVAVVAWVLTNEKVFGKGQLTDWQGPADWTIEISLEEKRTIQLQRIFDRLIVRGFGEDLLNLRQAATVSDQRKRIHTAFVNTRDKYRPFNDSYGYRVKVTGLVAALFLLQEVLFFGYRMLHGRYHALFRQVTVGCWLAGGLILVSFFEWFVQTFSGWGLVVREWMYELSRSL